MEILQVWKLSGLGNGWVGAHLTDAATGNRGVWLRIVFLSLITSVCVCQHSSLLLQSYLSITAPSTFLSTTHKHACTHAPARSFQNIFLKVKVGEAGLRWTLALLSIHNIFSHFLCHLLHFSPCSTNFCQQSSSFSTEIIQRKGFQHAQHSPEETSPL